MTSLSPGPAPIDAVLHTLVDDLLDGLRAGNVPPALLHVTAGDADGFDVGIKPLDGAHPTELLVGQLAPEEWHGLGVVCHGWAYHTAERGHPGRRRARVHVVTLLSRSGEVAHRLVVDGDEGAAIPEVDLSAEAPTGEQVDLLRRALSLPTDPPPCGTGAYWAIRWLSEILGHPADRFEDWWSVASLHPAIQLLQRSSDDPAARRILATEPDVVRLGRTFVRVLGWSQLRGLLGDGRLDVDELVPGDGEWFDDGSFARFLLNRCPPLAMLREEAVAHLPPPLDVDLLRALTMLDVPAASWPDATDHAA